MAIISVINMELINSKLCLIVVTLIAIITGRCIWCASDSDHDDDGYRFKSALGAVNSMYVDLVDNLPLDKRCERYITLLVMIESEGVPLEKTVRLLSTANQGVFDDQLDQIDKHKRIAVLMSGIDKYRTSKLAPGFIDLIDCLRSIESPMVHKYFNDRELLIIEELYRQVLRSPDLKIDPVKCNLPAFHSSMKNVLRILFRDNLQNDLESEGELEAEAEQEPRYPPPGDTEEQPSDSRPLSEEEQQQREFMWRLQRRKRREEKRSRDWGKTRQLLHERRKEDHLMQRERDRLRKRRRRILYPDAMRERERMSQQRRRDRAGEQIREEWRRKTEHLRRPTLTYRQKIIQLQMMQEYRNNPAQGQALQEPTMNQSALEPLQLPGSREHLRQMLERQHPDMISPFAADVVKEHGLENRQQPELAPPTTLIELLRPIPVEKGQASGQQTQPRPYLPLASTRPQFAQSIVNQSASSSFSFSQYDDLRSFQQMIMDSPAWSRLNDQSEGTHRYIEPAKDMTGEPSRVETSTPATPQSVPATWAEIQAQPTDRLSDEAGPSGVSSSVGQPSTEIDNYSGLQQDLPDPWQEFDREFSKRQRQ